ncbi:MAG: hypothetical protein EWV40_10305 [Microcystis flos-aquae Mf_WU_F_19750830_S460]|uniref:Uncharacterized protein n=1 Tax=Microcystis flos-aquae Mf_WU_F_19750830_S460 TaxID=2486237 RepID=A0A552LQ26_9CHRO|nr:MAG: hypothetical protein EWV40_10305 [Microcystis flos-aquae Mf_WU_F_19750830_S460]
MMIFFKHFQKLTRYEFPTVLVQIVVIISCCATCANYLSKINYTYLTPPLPLASCLLPFFTRKFILHDYLTTSLTEIVMLILLNFPQSVVTMKNLPLVYLIIFLFLLCPLATLIITLLLTNVLLLPKLKQDGQIFCLAFTSLACALIACFF